MRRKINSLVLLMQFAITVFILSLLLANFYKCGQMMEEAKRINNRGDVFFLQDNTSNEKIQELLSGDVKKLINIKTLYNKIYNKEFLAFPLYETKMYILDSRMAKIRSVKRDKIRMGMYSVDLVLTNEHFFDFFKVEFNDVMGLTDSQSEIPINVNKVVLGSDFSNIYKIGDILQDSNNKCYYVYGILKNDMSYIRANYDKDFRSLNNRIIEIVEEKGDMGASDYDSLICSTYIVTDSIEDVKSIVKMASELDTYNFIIRNLKNQFEYVYWDYSITIQFQLFLCTLLAVFLTLNFVLSILQYFKKNIFELAIHLISGATTRDLGWRVIFQITPFFIISNIITILLRGIRIEAFIALGISLLFTVFLCFISLKIVSGIHINTILRRYRDDG